MIRRTRRWSAVLAAAIIGGVLSVGAVTSPAGAATLTTTNSCQNNATGTFTDIDFTLSATAAPNPATLGVDTVTVTGTSVNAFFPATVLIAGYNLGLLTVGVNTIPGDMTFTLLGSNTVEGSQTLGPITIVGAQTTISDPDGTPGTGDETATPLSVTVALPDTTWTPTGGDVLISDGGSVTTASVAGGLISVTFTCLPGLSTPAGCVADPAVDCTGRTPVPAGPVETVTVVAPPTAPVCNNDAVSVGATQSTTVDLNALCSDVNGNLDPTTFTVVTAPLAGTVAIAGGVATYTNTDPNATTDSFTFTVADTGGLVSTAATVDITILGNLCDATAGPCQLRQVITTNVIGAALTMEQTAQFVALSDVTLNGSPQVSSGAINQVTVTNARGDGVGWTVTGFVTDFGAPGGPTTDPDGPGPLPPVPDCGFLGGTPDRLCIPGDNLGWSPSAAVAHATIPGDVAAVSAGPAHAVDAVDWLGQLTTAGSAGTVNGLGGLNEPNVLCSAAAGVDGGTFTCDATLWLGVPASAGAGTYTGVLTLTLT